MSRTRLLIRPLRASLNLPRQFSHSTSNAPSPLPLPLQSKFRLSYIWYGTILALGITTGLAARHYAAPLGLPSPGTPADKAIVSSLSKDIDKLDVVKTLRSQSYNLHSDTAIRSGPGLSSNPPAGGGRKISAYKGWMEVDLEFGREGGGMDGMLGVVNGTRGLGVQRAFWNAETREMVAVVWIGGGLSGWPGVAHGGAIATIFEEVMARMVRGPEGEIDRIHRPTSLSVTYAKPTYSLDFYIVRAAFSKPDLPQLAPPPEPESAPTRSWLSWLSPKKDLTKQESATKNMAEIIGTLESVKGDLCVRAKGTFAVPGPVV
ncbi:hypothetical protein IQ07DRAFT_587607 [Pyrenochaeta sp. DS3sAY3a]|nr:hypothetical protein IQ07DRAFT_587607 [Pyrenochaeta sp. DS3sAY3a]